jgi:dihydroorotase
LPHLFKLHAAFPKLRIVLEHATTRAAVEAVKQCGPTVACTITAHHLALTVDDWAGQSWNFCKPVAKYPDDRQALRDVVKEGKSTFLPNITRKYSIRLFVGHPRFFLGSDSAPHPPHAKSTSTPTHACAAGVYTSPILLPLVAQLLESFDALENIGLFVSGHGRHFYKIPIENQRVGTKTVSLRRAPAGSVVDEKYMSGTESLVPFWAGKEIGWEIVEQ